MKKTAFFFLGLILLSACNPKPEETVSFDDLTSDSEKYGNNDSLPGTVEKEVFYFDSISPLSQNLIDSVGFDRKLIFPLDSVLFSDRFGAKNTEKWYYRTDKDSLVFFHWEFKDSLKTFNTFYNWIDCYGPKCKSVQVGMPAAFSKRATLFLVEDKHLYFVESDLKITPENYLSYFDGPQGKLKKLKKWKYVVIQQPRKKAEWFARNDKGELVPIAL
ncbi:MAG: hypothetical protein K0R65_2105 [Crocinitomicaceae bacterium]|jgi:hypothetical protein|nr:hypothetical protein [Crocinitomicaceae bacterium]